MKNFLMVVYVTAMVFLLGACTGGVKNPVESVDGRGAVQAERLDNQEGEQKTKAKENSDAKDSVTPPEDAIEVLAALVEKDVEDTISALETECEQLKEGIDSYDKYVENTAKVEAFYTQVYEENKALCFRMYEYSYDYAGMILNSDLSCDDMYDELEVIYDTVYDDAGDEIYDGIYDGLLDDLYDAFYDGVFDDAYDTIPYSELSKVRSNEYGWLSDCRSDVYSDLSDCRSDIYDFYCDIRGEMWSDDIEKAKRELEKFREDIDKLKQKNNNKENSSASEEKKEPTPTAKPKASDSKTETEKPVDGMREGFKEALDSYEAFFDEYCAFMKKYKENPEDLSLIMGYAEFLSQYTETMQKMSVLNDGSLSDAELKYYLQVTNRVNEKLLEAAL